MKQMKTFAVAAAVLLASTSAMALRAPQSDARSRTAVTVIDTVLDRDARRDTKELDKRERKQAKELRKEEHERRKAIRKAERRREKDLRKAQHERAKEARERAREDERDDD